MMFKLLQIDASNSQTLTAALQSAFTGEPASLLIASGNVASMQALQGLSTPERYARNWIACSSCLGAASSAGLDQSSDRRLTLMAITDPGGSYGVASVAQT